MAVVYHEIYLPIDTESTFDYIVIKQGDAGTHRVRATLISNNRVYTIPTSGVSYYMKFRKPDNNYVLVQATVADNTISAEVTEEMLRVSGTGRGEFMIVSGSDELKTATFHVKIVKETFTSGDVQSHSDFAPFAALLSGAGAAASNANTAAAAANAAASLAEQKAQAIPDDYSDLVAEVEEVKADLQDLEETVDAMEPGLSDAAKAALLACLREIAFLDSSTNYAALEAALFDDYPKITVSYNPGQNIIYTDYELDTLKTYMTVKYYESSSDSGTTISSANYTLSGTLTEGVNSILCQYGNYTAAVAVTAVNRILYALENPVILDGSTYIDTGIDLLTTNRSFTILIDAVDACNHYTDTENKYTVQYAQNSSPWYQLNIQTYNGGTGGVASEQHKVRCVARVKSPSGVTKSIFDYVENRSAPDTTKHNRYVIRYNHTAGTFSFAMSRDGSKITPTTVDDNGYTYTQINRNLRISNSTGGFTGTIYAFNVYNYACSDAEINNFLGGN